jgi:alkylation response protein AidB-like acyl-CoA dehydrogenase
MIDLIPSADQQSVADSVAQFLGDQLPVSRLDRERHPDAPRDHALWPALAEIGCFSLTRPEVQGGIGLTLAEETLAFREYGRYLLTPSLLASVLARALADRCGDHALADRLAAGEQRAALALPVAGARSGAQVTGEWQLFDAQAGDLALAWSDDGFALLQPQALGDPRPVPCIDESLALAIVQAEGLPLLHAQAADLQLQALVLVAAQLVGLSEAVRDMAVLHAGTRVQFGQPIGTFQAIKHRCADMALRSEGAWSQCVYAALSVRDDHADAKFQAVSAKVFATRAALEGAADNIQVHGGMGFTAEIAAHFFLKRTHLWTQAGGNQRALHALLSRLAPPP